MADDLVQLRSLGSILGKSSKYFFIPGPLYSKLCPVMKFHVFRLVLASLKENETLIFSVIVLIKS